MLRLILLLFISGSICAETTVIVNVNVLPMDTEDVLRQQTVIVEDARIAAIGPVDSVPVPKAARLVDGTDRYLMPGFAELHAHVAASGSDDLERDLTLFVVNGVTTIRGMLGRPSHLELRRQLADGDRFGPRLVTSGPSLNGNSVSGVNDARRKVRAQHAAGYDFVKIHPGLDADEFAAIAETANELGIPFAGHVPVSVGVASALAQGIATIDHLDGYFAAMLPPNAVGSGGYGGFFDVLLARQLDESRIAGLVRRTVAAGTWNVPTQTLFEQMVSDEPLVNIRSRPELQYVAAAITRRWSDAREALQRERGFDHDVGRRAIELRRQLLRALHAAGAGILLGSDAPQVFNVPGFSLHRELELLVDAGLPPFAALSAGTSHAAEFLGLNTGLIAEGRDADLVLLDANPLEDIRNSQRIQGVMLRGRWLDAVEIERRLAHLRRGK